MKKKPTQMKFFQMVLGTIVASFMLLQKCSDHLKKQSDTHPLYVTVIELVYYYPYVTLTGVLLLACDRNISGILLHY